MLTIKEPIQLHNLVLNSGAFDSFGNRIVGNYNQINTALNETDFIHMVTQSPEVFYAEGDNTNYFFSDINVENKQQQKIEVITNFVNRVMLEADGNLTYQDRVYISNVLNKLGIKNENEFLSEVYKNLHQMTDVNQIVKLVNTEVNTSIEKKTSNIFETKLSNIKNNLLQQNTKISNQTKEMLLHHVENNLNNEEYDETLLNENNQENFTYNRDINNIVDQRINQVKNDFSQHNNKTRLEENTLNLKHVDTSIENTLNEVDATSETRYEDGRVYNKNEHEIIDESVKNINTSTSNSVSQLRQDISNEFTNSLSKLVEKEVKSQTKKVLEPASEVTLENTQQINVNADESIIVEEESAYSILKSRSELYNQIFNRLDLQNNIELISKFRHQYTTGNNITNSEMNLSSHNKILNQLSIVVAKERGYLPADIVLTTNNVFEEQPDFTEVTEEKINSQIIQAMLYSVVDSVYQSNINKNQSQSNWVNIGNSLYKSTENTMVRFEENLIAPPVEKSNIQNIEEQMLLEQIELMNENNLKREELYKQYTVEYQKAKEKFDNTKNLKSSKQAREDALTALNDENAFKKKLEDERIQVYNKQLAIEQERIESIPENLKARMELINIVSRAGDNEYLGEDAREAAEKFLTEIRSQYVSREAVEKQIESNTKETVSKELVSVNQNIDRQNIINNVIENINNMDVITEQKNITNLQQDFMSAQMVNAQTLFEETVAEAADASEVFAQSVSAQVPNRTSYDSGKPASVDLLHVNQEDVTENVLEEELIDKTVNRVVESQHFVEDVRQIADSTTQKTIRKTTPVIIDETVDKTVSMNLVHKENQQLDEEEIVEKIRELRTNVETEQTVVNTVSNIVNETVSEETTKNLIKKEIENIDLTSQIERTLNSKMTGIQNTIFSQLENKLSTDRQRRGF